MWLRLSVCLCSMVAPFHAAFANEAPRRLDDSMKTLMGRVAPASPEVMKEFESAGMTGVQPHALTNSERAKIAKALAALPALHRAVLAERLDRLSFVDGVPGAGTGLTAPSGKEATYSITFRASIIKESLTDFLTAKERRLFTSEEGGPSITISAPGMDALTFALLHESTHVVDNAIGITNNLEHPLIVNEWRTSHELKLPFANSMISATPFRGSAKIHIDSAESVYDALAQSPFVSLYATASASEDIAELVAWYQMSRIHGARFIIQIDDAQGKNIKRYEPLTSPLVKARFGNVKELLSVRTRSETQ